MNTNRHQCPQLVSSALTRHQNVALTNEASKKGVFRPAAPLRWSYTEDVMPLSAQVNVAPQISVQVNAGIQILSMSLQGLNNHL